MSGYPDVVLNESPRGYWRLNDKTGLVAYDSAGTVFKNGVYSGGVVLGEAGPLDDASAAHFDGTTGKVAISAFPGSATFTLVGWFKCDTATWATDVGLFNSRSNNGFFIHGPVGESTIRTWTVSSTGGTINHHYRALTISNWNFFAFSYNSSTGEAHWRLNGGVDDSTVTTLHTRTDTNIDIEIANDPTLTRFVDGIVAECAHFPYVLSNAQIDAMYKARPASVRYRADKNTSLYTVVKA